MGFTPGRIVESIVTTYNTDGSPNAAPIGVHTQSDAEISMNIHATTDTLKNLMRAGGCVVNVVFDPYLFVKTCLVGSGKRESENEITTEDVIPANNVDAPVLKYANAWLEVEMLSHNEHTKKDRHGEMEFSKVLCKVVNFNINKKYPVAVNRGLFAAIETAIAVSRGRKPDERHLEIMEKTLTSKEYRRIRELL
jgi:hypothetical protein